MKQMSIAMWHHLPSGGAKRALWQQVAHLKRRGHRVKVWAPSTADHSFLSVADFAEERVIPFESSSTPLWARKFDPVAEWKASLRSMKAVCDTAVAEMVKEGFDLLLAHGCQSFVIPPLPRKSRLPALLYHQEPNRGVHEARPELRWVELRPRSGWPYTMRSIRSWRELARIGAGAAYERHEAQTYDRLLTSSYFNRESIVRCYGLDAVVCYMGIDHQFFRPTELSRQDFVLGVGGAEPQKGIVLALQTMAMLDPKLPRRLVWAANKVADHYVEQIHSLAKELRVDFELQVRPPQDELVRMLGTAAAFLYSSTLEPFGLAPLEAMACGTAVVSVGEGGVREYIQHGVNGLLVGQRSPTALARELSRVLESPELAARLGEAGRRTVLGNWTAEHATDRVEANLREVLANR